MVWTEPVNEAGYMDAAAAAAAAASAADPYSVGADNPNAAPVPVQAPAPVTVPAPVAVPAPVPEPVPLPVPGPVGPDPYAATADRTDGLYMPPLPGEAGAAAGQGTGRSAEFNPPADDGLYRPT